jgi:hypothetical protein
MRKSTLALNSAGAKGGISSDGKDKPPYVECGRQFSRHQSTLMPRKPMMAVRFPLYGFACACSRNFRYK